MIDLSNISLTDLEVIEDSKGFATPEFKLKRAILAAQGITVREV